MSRTSVYSALLLLLLTLVALSPLLSAGFVDWDDTFWILRNPAVYPTPPSTEALKDRWLGPHLNLYSPLSHTIWYGLSFVAGTDRPGLLGSRLSAAPFHAVSIGLHLAIVSIVLALLARLTSRVAAFAGAAVFALHPMNVEAVAWASGLKDVLFTFFFALSLWATCRLTSEEDAARQRRWSWALVGLLILALLSKPTATVLPLACLLLALVLRAPAKPALRRFALGALIAFPFVILTIRWQSTEGFADPSPLHLRPLLATDAFGHYLSKFAWPAGLALDYGRTPSYVLADRHYLPYTLIFLAVSATIALTRDRLLLLGFALFLTPLLPVSGLRNFDFLRFSSVTDHYAYPATIGLALVLARVAERARQWWQGRGEDGRDATRAILCVTLVLAAVLTFRTRSVAAAWQSSETILAASLRHYPNGILANTNYASVLSRNGDSASAYYHAMRAISLRPNNAQAHYGAAIALSFLNRSREALPHYAAAAAMYEQNPEYHANYATALGELGQLEPSLAHYRRALELDPKNAQALRLMPYVESAMERRRSATRPATAPAKP